MEEIVFVALVGTAIILVLFVKEVVLFEYFYQKEATLEFSKKITKVNFEEFKKLFAGVEWEIHKSFKGSLFLKNGIYFDRDIYRENYLHAGIWSIGGVGIMPKNVFEFYKIDFFIKKEYKRLREVAKG